MQIRPTHPNAAASTTVLLVVAVTVSLCTVADASGATVVGGVAPQPRIGPATDRQALQRLLAQISDAAQRMGPRIDLARDLPGSGPAVHWLAAPQGLLHPLALAGTARPTSPPCPPAILVFAGHFDLPPPIC